jgi:hypothetical protein
MPRYKLRTLLILLAVAPPLLAGAWWQWQAWKARQAAMLARQRVQLFAPSSSVVIDVKKDSP